MGYGYHPEILEACQDYGLVLGSTLFEYDGWRTRGSSSFDPKGSVNHHTAGGRTGNLPSLWILLYGRPDLPGPLCNATLARDQPAIHLLAAGRANHAGEGGWAGLSGNSSVWGLEVEHIGYASEAVSMLRWELMWRWHRACIDVSGVGEDRVCQHFEWAPTRKIDFCHDLVPDPNAFRRAVGAVKHIGSYPIPEGDDMQWYAVTGKNKGDKWVTDWVCKYPLGGAPDASDEEARQHRDLLQFFGVCTPQNGGLGKDGKTIPVAQAQIDVIPRG